jgi:hypothetical protein
MEGSAMVQKKVDEEMVHKIYEVMLNHIGRQNAVKSNEIAKAIGMEKSGDVTNRMIRIAIVDVMKKYRVAIGSRGKGYYLITTKGELRAYIKSLGRRMREIKQRANLVWQCFNEMDVQYNVKGKEGERGAGKDTG